MATVTLTHPLVNSGSPVTIKCQSVSVNGQRNLEDKPNANPGSQVVVQVLSQENLLYTVSNVYFTGASGVLSYTDLLTIYRSTTAAVLTMTYGGGNTSLVGFDGSDTTISVQLKSFTFPIDAAQTKAGYLPIANLVFRESG